MGHGNPWNYSIVFFSTGIQHSRVYPAFCNQKFLWYNGISIHVFGKMKCRKLPTPFSWDCDLDQGSSTQSPHKKHARIFKKNSQQGEIGWNGIKPSWDSDFQCIFNWKRSRLSSCHKGVSVDAASSCCTHCQNVPGCWNGGRGSWSSQLGLCYQWLLYTCLFTIPVYFGCA